MTLPREIWELPLELIESNPIRMIDGGNINDMRESVKKDGILQPILVRPIPLRKGKKYQIVFGNHRYFSAIGARLKTIPAIIKDISEKDAVILSLVENVQRKNMNPYEEGMLFQKSLMSVNNLSERLGKSRNYIKGRIAIYEGLNPDLVSKIGDTLTIANAHQLAKLPKADQIGIAERVENYRKAETTIKVVSRGGTGGNIPWVKGGTPCVCPNCGVIHAKEWRKAESFTKNKSA